MRDLTVQVLRRVEVPHQRNKAHFVYFLREPVQGLGAHEVLRRVGPSAGRAARSSGLLKALFPQRAVPADDV